MYFNGIHFSLLCVCVGNFSQTLKTIVTTIMCKIVSTGCPFVCSPVLFLPFSFLLWPAPKIEICSCCVCESWYLCFLVYPPGWVYKFVHAMFPSASRVIAEKQKLYCFAHMLSIPRWAQVKSCLTFTAAGTSAILLHTHWEKLLSRPQEKSGIKLKGLGGAFPRQNAAVCSTRSPNVNFGQETFVTPLVTNKQRFSRFHNAQYYWS
jgi:hypothetical protein